jgi:hypothetical protein
MGDRFIDGLPVRADCLLASGFDLRDDCESITCGRFSEDRTVSSLFHLVLEVSSLRDRYRGWFRPIFLL